jgi:hypothetical protein
LSDWTVSGSNVKGELKFKGDNNKTDLIPAGEITMAEVYVDVASIHSERSEFSLHGPGKDRIKKD